MARKKPNTNPKKKNRYDDHGDLLVGIEKVRKLRKNLMKAQKSGETEEVLEKLRLELRQAKTAGKEEE